MDNMADAPTTEAMEGFFINPTFAMPQIHRQQISADDHLTSIADSNDALILKFGQNPTPQTKATITDLREPVLWHGYGSEEEVASPVDNDDLSFHSRSGDSESGVSSDSQGLLPEALAESCNKVEHRCNRAKAVVLRQVGKAKVVAVPKPVDISTQPCVVKPAGGSPNRRSSPPQLSRLRIAPSQSTMPRGIDPGNQSYRHRSEIGVDHYALTEARPLKRRKSLDRLPSVPLLHAAAQTNQLPKKLTPLASRSVSNTTMSKRAPSPTESRPLTPPVSPPPSNMLRRMNRIGSTINLHRFARNSSRHRRDSNSGEPEVAAANVSGTDPDSPTRRLSSRPKLVARGGNERAPPIVLPPFPGEDGESEHSHAAGEDDPRSWPERKSSSAPMHLRRLPLSVVPG